MGEMADYYRESEGYYQETQGLTDDPIDGPIHDQIDSNSLWRTRDGKQIPIKQMSADHLLATIRALSGRSPLGTKIYCHGGWLTAMLNEAEYRRLKLV